MRRVSNSKKKKIYKPSINLYTGITASELKSLIDTITDEDLEKYTLELDWGSCFYEGDTPGIELEYNS